MPYQSHHPQLVATSQDGGPWGFLQKLVSDYNKGDHGSSLRAMEGRPRGDHSSRSASLTVCPNRFLEGTESHHVRDGVDAILTKMDTLERNLVTFCP